MARTSFLHTVLWKFMENIDSKPIFSQYNIFYIQKYIFFSICVLISFQSKPKTSSKSGTRQSVLQLATRALTTDRCNAFQHILLNQKKLEFYGPYFQAMLFLVTMITPVFLFNKKSVFQCTCHFYGHQTLYTAMILLKCSELYFFQHLKQKTKKNTVTIPLLTC